MKRRYLMTGLLLFVIALAGCECSHQWTDADCLSPQICTKCQTVGEGALGHQWIAADCTQAETCSRCGATQGDPLGHSYGNWMLEEEQMSHICSACGFEEVTAIDRELYLETLLPGHWDFLGMYEDDAFISAEKVDFHQLHFYIDADGTVTFTIPGSGTRQGSWRFDSYQQEDGADSYYFTLTSSEETYDMCLRHNPDGKLEQPEKELVMLSKRQILMFSQYDSLDSGLVGDWGISMSQWGLATGNTSHWLTFQADRTVSGWLNGTVEGSWHIAPVYSTNWRTPSSYKIVIENNAAEKSPVLLKGTLTTSKNDGLRIQTDGVWETFCGIDEGTLEAVKLATQVHLGTWTSATIMSPGGQEKATTEYSVTFHNDNTFTANLGKEIKGNWAFREFTEPNQPGDNKTRIYRYFMYAKGIQEKIYCEVDARLEEPVFVIYQCPLLEDSQVNFEKFTEEEAAYQSQGATYLIGNWTSFSYRVINDADYSLSPESISTEDYSVTFRKDGTFTAKLDQEMTGTWEYSRLEKDDDDSGGSGYLWYYALTFDETNQFEWVYVRPGDNPDIFIYVPHPDDQNCRISYEFRKDTP